MDSVRKGPIDMGAAEQNSTLAAQTPTLAHASMWCCIIATPATGNKGLGTSNDSGLNRVPFKQIQITFFFFLLLTSMHFSERQEHVLIGKHC